MPSDGQPLDRVPLDWIAVDWGTTQLRCWAMSATDTVLDHVSSPRGMGTLTAGEFEPALIELIGDWLKSESTVPVLCCGMAGARGGWCEAPYRSVPCAPVVGSESLSVQTEYAHITVQILPGLSQAEPADVMRGEETAVAGLMACGVQDGVVCLPGSHSKWVRVVGGQVDRFSSYLTGEAFAALSKHTVLRLSLSTEEKAPDAAFCDAVKASMDAPQNTLCAAFGLRPAALLDGLDPDASRSQLSGQLIGLELAGARDHWRTADYVHLVGETALVARYKAALDVVGVRALAHDPTQLTLLGLTAARQALRN